ncbi:hypothetical protein H5410_012537 [Solanum commersonii]|uniref:Uncharacterized protein n=1 Tax=Solanum commersonii TaxID=4109 RepID=A0A9J6AT43_SOLCO|nr:hypothetical protein H5410_012537 [Solanum commersonii]
MLEGASNTSFRRQCQTLVCMHKSFMMVILEITMADHAKFTEELCFDAQIQSVTEGLSGGIMIIWKEDTFKFDNIFVTTQGIHVMVKNLSILLKRLVHWKRF